MNISSWYKSWDSNSVCAIINIWIIFEDKLVTKPNTFFLAFNVIKWSMATVRRRVLRGRDNKNDFLPPLSFPSFLSSVVDPYAKTSPFLFLIFRHEKPQTTKMREKYYVNRGALFFGFTLCNTYHSRQLSLK